MKFFFEPEIEIIPIPEEAVLLTSVYDEDNYASDDLEGDLW